MIRTPSSLLAPAAALVLVVCLGGCSATEPAGAASTPTTAPGTSPQASQEAAELPAGVLGTAALFDVSGAAVGAVEVTRSGEFVEVHVELTSGAQAEPIELVLSPRDIAADERCFDDGTRFAFGQLEASEPLRWGVADLGSGDPSFLDEAVLVQVPVGPTAGDCLADVVAHGHIEWMFAPLRSGLTAADQGATGGARGDVTLEAGVPVGYQVAPGDLIEEVAARFGLAVDDVHYLNPARVTTGGIDTLHPDEVLNLVVARR